MSATPPPVTRRRFGTLTGITAAFLWVGTRPATAQVRGFTASDRALMLRLARIGTIFPVPVSGFESRARHEHGSTIADCNGHCE